MQFRQFRQFRQFKHNRQLAVALVTAAIAGCATPAKQYQINPDKMQQPVKEQATELADLQPGTPAKVKANALQRLPSLPQAKSQPQSSGDLALQFSDSDSLQIAAKDLPIREFLQSVFADHLKVNYILAEELKDSTVTLNIQEAVSSRRLFTLTNQLLDERQLQITKREDVYFVHPRTEENNSGVVLGFGRRAADVPESINRVMQIVPLRYGVKSSMDRSLRGLSAAQITADFEQNAFFIQGTRDEVLKALDVINLLDIPSARSRYVGLTSLTYVSVEEYTEKLSALLGAEGINASTTGASGAALVLVPIKHIGAVAMFTGDEMVLQRAEFWSTQIDKATQGPQKRYFLYHPRFARAADLGASLAPLIGGVGAPAPVNRSRDTQSAQSGQNRPAAQPAAAAPTAGAGSLAVAGELVRMTVDERSNSLIFQSTGEDYQALLPIIQRLDVLPKQILLDATIAEVTMSDEFAQGFEFAFRSGRLNGGTVGNMGASGVKGLSLNWTDGVSNVLARLSASTNLINVLSNPTLVVRDGVAASLSVGNDIPTVGSTSINPGTETSSTNVVYRKTGVTLDVTPTINAQGLVVLQIEQSISNVSKSGPVLAGSSSVFERRFQTELIAESGTTVFLGGLISENNNDGGSKVLGLADIPLLGNLFKGKTQSREKTELVVFITPRVIDSVSQWDEIRNKIAESLTSISLSD